MILNLQKVFFFFAAGLKIQQQNAYKRNTDTSGSFPSWQINGLLAVWHEDMNQRNKKCWQRWLVIMFTNTQTVPCASTPPKKKRICMIYKSLIFRLEKPDFGRITSLIVPGRWSRQLGPGSHTGSEHQWLAAPPVWCWRPWAHGCPCLMGSP